MSRILVIKLGALGDFVLAFGPFAAIRARHPGARITLLTTRPFAALARRAPWFDEVREDARPAWWNLTGLARLARRLRGFDFVYDLQTSSRSGHYRRLAGRPPWSGIAPGASHPHANPARDRMHTLDRQREQLAMAGVAAFPEPDLSWLASEAGRLPGLPPMPARIALLAPGAAPHRPDKRWPAARFGALANALAAQGLAPVAVGTGMERSLAAEIGGACGGTLDLTGRTSLSELASLAARAALAVGNDTGPMHLAAAMGCPCVVLFSDASDPVLTAPRGRRAAQVRVVRTRDLRELPATEVITAVEDFAKRSPPPNWNPGLVEK